MGCCSCRSQIKKCNILTIGKVESCLGYNINDIPLPNVTSCRDFGVTVSSNLSPAIHISEVIGKTHHRSAEANVGRAGKLNGNLMASCVRNILTENYQNLLNGFQVTVENVGDVFTRESRMLRAFLPSAGRPSVRPSVRLSHS